MKVYDDYRAYFDQMRRELDAKVAALSPADHTAWYQELADHEYFDGEVEIEAGYFDRWIADRRQGPARCVKCGRSYRRIVNYAVIGNAIHFHQER